MSQVIRFTDIGEAYRVLQQLPEKMTQATLEALNEAADFMITMAQSYCLVDTGTLQGSIRKEQQSNAVLVIAGGREFVNPKTGRGCDYAVYVEHKNPFMRPAWETVRNFIEQKIVEKTTERIER